MMTRKGFTLVEVLIVIGLVSLLLAALFSSFLATNRITNALEDEMDIYDALVLIDRQCARDIAGAFIPFQAQSQEKKKEASKEVSAEKPAEQAAMQPAASEPKVKILKDPFMSTNDAAGNLSALSLISNNPMRVFWSDSAGKPMPSVVRVFYSLQADPTAPKEKPLYTLYRQEGTQLDIGAYRGSESPIERYPISTAVKSLSVTFVVEYQPEPAKGSKEKPPKETKIFSDWFTDEPDDLRTKVKLPTRVIVRLEIWDAAQEQTREFALIYPVAAAYSEPKEPTQQAQPAAPQAAPKPPQAGAKTAPQKPSAAPAKRPPRAPAQKLTQRKKNQQIITSAQNIIEELQAMFAGTAAAS